MFLSCPFLSFFVLLSFFFLSFSFFAFYHTVCFAFFLAFSLDFFLPCFLFSLLFSFWPFFLFFSSYPHHFFLSLLLRLTWKIVHLIATYILTSKCQLSYVNSEERSINISACLMRSIHYMRPTLHACRLTIVQATFSVKTCAHQSLRFILLLLLISWTPYTPVRLVRTAWAHRHMYRMYKYRMGRLAHALSSIRSPPCKWRPHPGMTVINRLHRWG